MTPKEYSDALRELPCIVCGQWPVQLHHALGGSMLGAVGVRGRRKHSDWLQMPLCHNHHQGADGIHTIGVKTWEIKYGYQVDIIMHIGQRFGINPFELSTAAIERKRKPSSKIISHSGKM